MPKGAISMHFSLVNRSLLIKRNWMTLKTLTRPTCMETAVFGTGQSNRQKLKTQTCFGLLKILHEWANKTGTLYMYTGYPHDDTCSFLNENFPCIMASPPGKVSTQLWPYVTFTVEQLLSKSPPWLCFSTCQGESLTKQWTYGPT